MDTKTCVKCAKTNENHFTYCKNCGALLPVVDKQQPYDFYEDANNAPPSSGVVDYRDYDRYVGENAELIVPKFETMDRLGSKISFCAPVLFLGLFFGFFGMSAWFFCRKMRATAILLILCGVLLVVAEAFLNAGLNRDFFDAAIMSIKNAYSLGPVSWLSDISYNITIYANNFIPVSAYGSIIPTFIMAFFGMNIYKNKATKDIFVIKTGCQDQPALNIILQNTGGRKTALTVIPFAVMLVANILAFGVTVI